MQPDKSETRLRSLMEQSKTIDMMSESEKTKYLANLIDLSLDTGDKSGIELGIKLAVASIETSQDSKNVALLHYFASNAYDWLSRAKQSIGQSNHFNWIQNRQECEILHLRKALICQGFNELHIQYRCSIYINLATALSTIGRSVEGLRYLWRSIGLLPEYGMAVGNVGSHLLLLSKYMPTDAYQTIYLNTALQYLEQALMSGKGLTQEAIGDFQHKQKFISKVLGNKRIDLKDIDRRVSKSDRSKPETDYRTWASKEVLFLCPINDLFPLGSNGHDCLHLPNVVRPIHERPHLHGIVNQLIQEFVSIRFQVYEGIYSSKVHFSDQDVNLINIPDFSPYSLSLERLRGSFRVLFSLFDKIAFFMNLYFELGIPDHKVTFGSIWYKSRGKIREEFLTRQSNRPLQGLFWLSKDLSGNDKRFLEPEADEMRVIRNHLEHKYLKIIEWEAHELVPEFPDPLEDKVAHKISRARFIDKTVHLLRLVRNALVYLLFAVEYEEKSKRGNGNIVSIPVSRFDDDWKR